MKMIGLALSAALVLNMTACAQNNGHTQTLNYAAAYRTPGRPMRVDSFSSSSSSPSVLKPEFINNINVSAVRDFVGRYKHPSNARWYKLQDGSLIVKFEAPDIAWRVAYRVAGFTVFKPTMKRKWLKTSGVS